MVSFFFSFYYKYSCNEYSFFVFIDTVESVSPEKYLENSTVNWENLISVDILPSKFLFFIRILTSKVWEYLFPHNLNQNKTFELVFFSFIIFSILYIFPNRLRVIFYKFFVYWWNLCFSICYFLCNFSANYLW